MQLSDALRFAHVLGRSSLKYGEKCPIRRRSASTSSTILQKCDGIPLPSHTDRGFALLEHHVNRRLVAPIPLVGERPGKAGLLDAIAQK